MLNAVAQLTLKLGMRNIGYFDFHVENFGRVLRAVGVNPHILTGLTCYIFSVAVWLLVLSRVDVSYAYPFLSFGYIVTALAAWLFLGEAVTVTRCAGIVVICLGVWLITRSA
jgi:drug/metabolite transporter (DMT)-like permease